MKTGKWLFLIFYLFIFYTGAAQDEGPITKKVRVTQGKSVYFYGGPAFHIGSEKGDYSKGINLDAGYLVRLNKVLSIGPSLSFSRFYYDETISDSFAGQEGDSSAHGNNIFIEDGGYAIKIVYLEGGDLTHFTLGFDVKVDFIPMSADRRLNAYGLFKPFMLLSMRSEVSATAEPWYQDEIGDPISIWYYTGPPDEFLEWGSEAEFSGGVDLGVGAEYSLPSGVSFFLQGAMRMTFPITHINTSEFSPSIQSGFDHQDYPFSKKGFTTFTISLGASYRF